MVKKKIALIVAVLMILMAAVGCSQQAPASGGEGNESARPQTLRMSITVSENSSWYEGATLFGELLEERTNGRYLVDVYPNEQLSGGDTVRGIEMVQSGVTDLDIHSTIIWTGIDPKFTVVNMPWLIPSYDEADAALSGPGKEMLFDLARDKGVVPLALGESGFRQVTNNVRPITTPADMNNLKLRVPGIRMYVDLFSELGADPTAMNFSEVFTSLQMGTIDGQENPLDVITSARLEEVQKYMTMWNYSYDTLMMTVSENVWNSLSDEDKVIFQEAATEAMDFQKQRAREINAENLEYLNEYMEIYEMTAEEIAVFREAVQPIYDAFESIIGLELLEAFGYEK
ncbi:tripartite ATP-independent transporter solute receptor, DctP family [Natronincola peptidivorans]|uniref:Tripartite ATP-independent transporter solute receptor, DctP family n=1 Tax=Natronincola peptidivorans TaxID=426128 RepID=A0A1I0BMG2_9FIRM|nr:DctP family TRAP transporter solute-binding subunit [Natronincola peptidivorans]SET08153.1 tripartite ATP-independent transporter solute receptor, DctP family [Natronincola peptidivorans]